MPRATLPLLIAILGILGASALALTTYTQPIQGASADPDLYNLLAAALGDPPVRNRPLVTQSPLPITSLAPSNPATIADRPSAIADTTQPFRWAHAAAAADSVALREWLGPAVLATAGVHSPDTLSLTLHRISLHAGCPLFSTLTAAFVSKYGDSPRLAHLTSSCPNLKVE